jgi:hypothetical protein
MKNDSSRRVTGGRGESIAVVHARGARLSCGGGCHKVGLGAIQPRSVSRQARYGIGNDLIDRTTVQPATGPVRRVNESFDVYLRLSCGMLATAGGGGIARSQA